MKDKRQTLSRIGNTPSPLSGDNGGPINGEIDILAGVDLKSFEANPSSIKPFGFSILSWRVEGPRGFHVELQHEYVPKIGEKVITPPITGIYELTAHTRDSSIPLGQVQVVVDTTGCVVEPAMLNPKDRLESALTTAIENNPQLYFQSYLDDTGEIHYIHPTVSFSSGQISFSLRLYARTGKWYIPDPTVDIDASFGLAVEAGSLIPINQEISVDVSFPWYAWNWNFFALLMAQEDGEKMAKKYTEEGIVELTKLINFFASLNLPPNGKRFRTVFISEGVNGIGAINVTSCPYDLIKDFANVSGTVGVIT